MENKFRVLIVHNYYQIPGGEDMVVANEKRMLEEHGHVVYLYCRNNSELREKRLVQKLLLPFATVFNPKTYAEIRRIIKEKRIDIVHVHNTLCLISPAVYYAAKDCNVPIVQTIHNFRLLCPGATYYRDGHICEDCVSYGLGCAVKHSCYRGSKLQTMMCVISTKLHRLMGIYGKINYICLTEFNQEKLMQLEQIKSEQVFVKYNYVESAEALVPKEKRQNQFIFVGRLDKLKGIDLLLEAWHQMGENAPKLLVCGSGPMENWCKEYVAKYKINVEIRGYVPNQEVKHMIANSKALILPTQWYEGFPMCIAESIAAGTPVICSDLGNAGSLIQEGITGCKYEGNSSEKLTQAVYRLDSYPSIYETTLEKYRERYTQTQNYACLMKIYQKIAQ